MITRDLHGYTQQEAAREVDLTIAHVRIEQIPQDVEFITGSGIIRDVVMDILKEYDIQPSCKLGNSGVVVAFID